MRCYIPSSQWGSGDIPLGKDESHHAQHVLRAKPGSSVDVFDGEGWVGTAEVVTVTGKRGVTVRIVEQETIARPVVSVHLVQAVAREQKMDFVIQKATELGVAGIHPVETTRAVVRLSADQVGKRLERWKKIALGAAKQCGTPWLPELSPLQPLKTLLPDVASYDLALVCSLETGVKPLREVLDDYPAVPARVCAFVGPEGDFSAEEYEALRVAGARPVSLGPLVLRTETAALFMASVLRYTFPGNAG